MNQLHLAAYCKYNKSLHWSIFGEEVAGDYFVFYGVLRYLVVANSVLTTIFLFSLKRTYYFCTCSVAHM